MAAREAAFCQRVEDNTFHPGSADGGSASPEDDGSRTAEGASISGGKATSIANAFHLTAYG